MSDDFFQRPAAVNKLRESDTEQAKTPAPLTDAQRFPVVGKKPGVALIAALFVAGCPAAIGRFITAVVVDAFQSVLGGRLGAKIGKKIPKALFTKPALAHLDSPATVVAVRPIIRIAAAVHHANPGEPFRSFAAAVRDAAEMAAFCLKATAAACMSAGKVCSLDGNEVTAIAGASPEGTLGQHSKRTRDEKSPEPLTCQVLKNAHRNLCFSVGC